MAARKNRGAGKDSMSQNWKDRIGAGVIADRLYKGFNGEIKLDANQLKAAELLFKRIEPELTRAETKTEHSGKVEHHVTWGD